MASHLEDGYLPPEPPDNDKEVDTGDASNTWSMVSSLVHYIAADSRNKGAKDTSGMDPARADTPVENVDGKNNATPAPGPAGHASNSYIPMLLIHSDPVRFLKREGEALLQNELPKLTELHKQYLQSGDTLLGSVRIELLQLLGQITNNYNALNEIYFSEKNSKKSKLALFNAWIDRKSAINNTIKDILENSPEGQTYTSLLIKSDKIADRIKELENELASLKKTKRLVDHQVLETKSLLDIKLNQSNDSLELLENQEKEEITLLFKEKQIKSDGCSDIDVSNALKSQINDLDTIITSTSRSELRFKEFGIYLNDIFNTLDQMEESIRVFLQESKLDKIEPILVSNRNYLIDRIKLIKRLDMSFAHQIVTDELKAIEKAMSLLNMGISQSDPQADDFLHLSNDSLDYYQNVPAELSSTDDSNKISLHLSSNDCAHSNHNNNHSISVSPPKVTTATTTTNINIQGFKSNNTTTTKSKGNKYNLVLSEIKNAKGDKTD